MQVVTQLNAPRKRWPSTIFSWGRNMAFRFNWLIGSIITHAARRRLRGRWLTSSFIRDRSPGLGIDQRRMDRQVDVQLLSNFYRTQVRSLGTLVSDSLTHSLPFSGLD